MTGSAPPSCPAKFPLVSRLLPFLFPTVSRFREALPGPCALNSHLPCPFSWVPPSATVSFARLPGIKGQDDAAHALRIDHGFSKGKPGQEETVLSLTARCGGLSIPRPLPRPPRSAPPSSSFASLPWRLFPHLSKLPLLPCLSTSLIP